MTMESELQSAIRIAVSARGALVRRHNVGAAKDRTGRLIRFGNAGEADLAIIYRGRAIEVEVKRPGGGRQSKAQIAFGKAVERAGGVYIVARSVNAVLEALDRIDAEIDGVAA